MGRQKQRRRVLRALGIDESMLATLIPLVSMCDFEPMAEGEAQAVFDSMPSEFRQIHNESNRKLLGVYEVAGDSISHMYFMHSYNPVENACACALVLDFSKDMRMPESHRTWTCLNPRRMEVQLALDICSAAVHQNDSTHGEPDSSSSPTEVIFL